LAEGHFNIGMRLKGRLRELLEHDEEERQKHKMIVDMAKEHFFNNLVNNRYTSKEDISAVDEAPIKFANSKKKKFKIV
jgi:hypothetical protein